MHFLLCWSVCVGAPSPIIIIIIVKLWHVYIKPDQVNLKSCWYNCFVNTIAAINYKLTILYRQVHTCSFVTVQTHILKLDIWPLFRKLSACLVYHRHNLSYICGKTVDWLSSATASRFCHRQHYRLHPLQLSHYEKLQNFFLHFKLMFLADGCSCVLCWELSTCCFSSWRLWSDPEIILSCEMHSVIL